MTRAGRCPIGPECKWRELGEGWQECGTCSIERRDPRLADRAAIESGRKVPTEPIRPAVGDLRAEVARRFVDGKWTPQTGGSEDVA